MHSSFYATGWSFVSVMYQFSNTDLHIKTRTHHSKSSFVSSDVDPALGRKGVGTCGALSSGRQLQSLTPSHWKIGHTLCSKKISSLEKPRKSLGMPFSSFCIKGKQRICHGIYPSAPSHQRRRKMRPVKGRGSHGNEKMSLTSGEAEIWWACVSV